MSNYERPLMKLLQRCQSEVTGHDKLTELAEIELVSLVQILVLHLDECSKASDQRLRYLRGLLTLYGATGARDQFRIALRQCLDEAADDYPTIYAIANLVCYASGSGKLGTEDDYAFFEALFTDLYGADYFLRIVEHLAGSNVYFHFSDGEIS